jgi:hypothetical protein
MQLPKWTARPLLTGYKQVYIWIGGAIIVATVITGGFFVWKSLRKPATPGPTPTNTQVTAPAVLNYDGLYRGTTAVAAGLADVIMTVGNNNTINGTATYKGTYAGYPITAPVTLLGTVSSKGVVSGGISGSGKQYGRSYTIGGGFQGQITGNTMACTYRGTGGGEPYSGNVTLVK